MILTDISAAFHMCTHRTANLALQESKHGEMVDLKNFRNEFNKGMLWILDTHYNLFRDWGDLVICIDDKTKPNWRKVYYPMYKSQRKKFRDSQRHFDYSDAYHLFDDFLEATEKLSGIKCIRSPGAEADDIILTIGDHYSKLGERVMVLSPDKDFIQLQENSLVSQYSWATKKMITAEDKNGLDSWKLEHICLGDKVDAVPRILDFQEFKPGVREYLKETYGFDGTPFDFSWKKYDEEEFSQFGGVFNNPPFGPAKLGKLLEVHGSLESLLESNPVIKANYERNEKLVMASGIPEIVKNQILQRYQDPGVDPQIEEYANTLGVEIHDLPEFLRNKYLQNMNMIDLW